MAKPQNPILWKVLKTLIRPAVGLALRSGILLQEMIQLLKEVYVEVADTHLSESLEKVNVSRLSVMTGVHRADVTAIFKKRETVLTDQPITLISKVMAKWANSRQFTTSAGAPRVLGHDGAKSDFWKLVESVSTNVNPGTVLFELIRNGAAEITPRGLKLVRQTRAIGEFPDKAYNLLSKDIESLVGCVQENIANQSDPALIDEIGNAHYRTEYDSIDVRQIQKLRAWIIDRSRRFHQEMRRHLAKLDADFKPNKRRQMASPVAKVSVTVFSFVQFPASKNRDEA